MKPTLRANLTWKMTALFATTLVVLGAVAYWSSRSTVSDLSDRILSLATASADDKVRDIIEKAEGVGQVVAGFVAPPVKEAQTLTNAGDFDELYPRLLEISQANPELSSIGFTWERTGEFIKVLQLSSGRLVVQMSRIEGSSRIVREYSLYGRELNPIEETRDQSDRRIELWYQDVKASTRPRWSPVHLMTNTAESPVQGVTYARPVYDRRNQFLGVATVDVSVLALSRFVNMLKIGTSGYAAVLENSKVDGVRVVAHPQTNQLLVSESGREKLMPIDKLNDRVLVTLKKAIDDGRVDPDAPEPLRRVFEVDGKRYQLGLQSISEENRPNWISVVVVSDDEFMGGIWQTGFFLAALGGMSLVLVLAISYVMAQRVAQPLQDLVVETNRIKSLDLRPRPTVRAEVRELDELTTAMENMKAGLRSLEKLVPGDYARYLIATGQEAKLGGERRHITTYFADIIGFTALSERMPPEELVEVLAEYLDVLSSEVIQLGGTVDKFNGDDVMAFWGAPNPQADHAFLACRSAVASQKTLSALHTEWLEQGKPIMRASFGISTGDVIVGNVGSRQRMNYTVIGDAVNLASRLQGLNKYYGTEILIGPQCRSEAGDRIVARTIDFVSVAGRGEPVQVSELLGITEDVDAETVELAAKYEQALELYRSRQWQAAAVHFNTVLKVWPDDGPSKILLERCERYLQDPPHHDWDGSVQLSMK